LEIAKRYKKLGKYDAAERINKQTAQLYAGSSFADFSRFRIEKTNIMKLIDSGQDEAALAAIDKLIDDFNDVEHSRLYKALSMIEEMYYRKLIYAEKPDRKDHSYSIKVWDKILEKCPDFYRDEPYLYYHIACCYYQLQRYNEAIDYFNMVVDSWPDFRYAWGALELIKECCKGLTGSGEITDTEAENIIEESYFRVIQMHPGSVLAQNVGLSQGYIHFDNANWADAAKYFEAYLLNNPEGEQYCAISRKLIHCYQQMGEYDLVVQLYDEFVENCLNSR